MKYEEAVKRLAQKYQGDSKKIRDAYIVVESVHYDGDPDDYTFGDSYIETDVTLRWKEVGGPYRYHQFESFAQVMRELLEVAVPDGN